MLRRRRAHLHGQRPHVLLSFVVLLVLLRRLGNDTDGERGWEEKRRPLGARKDFDG